MGCWTPPFGNPQVSLRYPDWPNSSPLRGWSFGAVGEGRERVRARHDCRTSTASFGGSRPLAPCVPLWGTFAGHARLAPTFPKGESLPIMRARAWYRVRNGFCGNAPANLPEAPAAQAARSSVTPLARIAAEGRASATAGGIPKGAQPSLASLCLLSAGQKVGARRGLSASKGKRKNLIRRKKDRKSPASAACKPSTERVHKIKRKENEKCLTLSPRYAIVKMYRRNPPRCKYFSDQPAEGSPFPRTKGLRTAGSTADRQPPRDIPGAALLIARESAFISWFL